MSQGTHNRDTMITEIMSATELALLIYLSVMVTKHEYIIKQMSKTISKIALCNCPQEEDNGVQDRQDNAEDKA